MFFGNSGGGGGGSRGGGAGRAEETVMVRVHNDDVHTFEYVISTFTDLGISYHNVRRRERTGGRGRMVKTRAG